MPNPNESSTDKNLVAQFGAGLLDELAQLEDAAEDSALSQIDTSDSPVKFLPRYTVKKDQFTIKGKNGDIVREGRQQAMVIHDFHPYVQRVFYKNGFDPKNMTAPDCGSNGAPRGEVERPDPSVVKPMSGRCDTCEYNGNGCKLKQNIIVSEKMVTGTPQLMLMTCNATTVFNNDGDSKQQFGLNRFLKEVAKIGKGIHQYVVNFHIWPDGNCMVKFQPAGAITNPEDPNMVAHHIVKDSLDMAEVCRMDFKPWEGKNEDDVIENPAPSTTVSEGASEQIDDADLQKTNETLDEASAAVDAFLKEAG